jgi:hypothetical protein
MKTVTSLILLLLLSLPAVANGTMSAAVTKNIEETRVGYMRIILNTFTALAEENIAGTLRGLKVLSVTKEVKSGDWEGMKGLLSEFNNGGIHAAAVWYARTDGQYYTVEKGFTDQNLSDRPYFSQLMAGKPVVGDLVISKSTGKRAVIVAVPIRKDGKVVGALGVSLSAGEVSRMLQEKMALPGDMVFYALDAQGQCSLNKETSRLFAYPSDIGSKTLKNAVREMLSRQEGVVRYEFHGEKIVLFKRSNLTAWVFAIGFVAGTPSGAEGDGMPPIISELGKEISLKLSRIDADLIVAAKGLSKTGLHSPEARKILRGLCRSTPYAVDCATVDSTGIMRTVEPEEYRRFEGADIGKQEQIVRLRATKKPVMSKVIRTVEGFDAVDIEHPVFSSQGEFIGSVSILIRPEALISGVATNLVQGLPIDIWAMQTDGRILYDPDTEEIGKMLFEAPIYEPFPQLQSMGATISKEKSGSGSYEFFAKGLKKPVTKYAYWTSAGLYGTEWRVVATHTQAENVSYGKRGISDLGVKSSEESLRDLAEQGDLQEALAGNDRKKIQDIFRNFLAEQYGIYAIQWVDAHGVNRYGYPEENSPVNFDFHSMKTPTSKYILKALSEQKATSFEAPLVEGKIGNFFMIPVRKVDTYLGMIYIIRIRP